MVRKVGDPWPVTYNGNFTLIFMPYHDARHERETNFYVNNVCTYWVFYFSFYNELNCILWFDCYDRKIVILLFYVDIITNLFLDMIKCQLLCIIRVKNFGHSRRL